MKLNRVIIAEIGSVHDGSFGNALKAVRLAATCGADIVKFQTHLARFETRIDAPSPPYFSDESRYEYFERTAFSRAQWLKLKQACVEAGVGFLSSPFSIEAVDLLEDVGVQAYKIPSGEVTNTPMLERIAATDKPVLLSSGMSDWAEIDRAVDILKGAKPLVIMQCTSEYPCAPERVGLNVLSQMRSRYQVGVGFSDHTLGLAAGVAAAAFGAEVIEKHLTFSKHMYGSDAANSLEPEAFKQYCEEVRQAWEMVANPVDKDDLTPYSEMKRVFEKSIVAAHDLPAGARLKSGDLAFKKPGDGLPACRYRELIGRTTAVELSPDQPIRPEHLKS